MIATSFSSLSRVGVVALLAMFAMSASSNHADAAHPAKHAAHPGQKAKGKGHKRALHGPNYHPPYAAIVLDDNTSQVLHGENIDEPRHPASLTKIMTLYLLFEQIDAGKLKLDSQLPVSEFAARSIRPSCT
jgi:D-alanyl-D-alanine carboxypeptidase